MCKFIGVEVLAANALIELIENEKDAKVEFNTLHLYGLEVIEYISNNYNQNAIMIFDKNAINGLVLDYSDYFNVEGHYIILKNGITADDLREKFIGSLSYVVFKALVAADVLQKSLGV